MNIEVPTKYPPSQDRIVVFAIRLHSKSPMLYRPAFHGNWNALSFARRALKDKFPTPTVPLTTVLPNRQVFLPDPVWRDKSKANIHELDVWWNKRNEKKNHTKHWVRFHRGCSTSFSMQHMLSEIWRENIRFYVPLITGFFNINPLMQNMFIVFVSLCLCSSSHFLFCRIPIFALLRVSCWRLVCGVTLSYARGVYRIIQYMQIFQYHTR